MKNILFIALAAIAMIAVYAFTNPKVDFKTNPKGGIQFEKGNWAQAIQTAKKENKLIFLDVYATWCGPCKKLKASTFSDASVGSFYNQNFVNIALDGEQGDGAMLMEKYGLSSYPSLLFIDGNGTVVAQTAGYYKAKDFLKMGQKMTNK